MNEIEYNRMEENAALGECHAKLLAALKEFDTGRWQWDQIDCCLTSKNADLEPWGQQGVHLDRVTEDDVTFTVHGLKTFAGDDVCLNLPPEIEDDDEKFEAAREAYLEYAQYVVVEGTYKHLDVGEMGAEWDGDSWVLSFEGEVTIPWVGDGDSMFEDTAKAILAKAEEVIRPWEDEMVRADEMLNQLAGWIDEDGTRCEEGKPGAGSVWSINDDEDQQP